MGNLKDFATSIVTAAPDPSDSGTELDVQTGQGVRFPEVPFAAVAHPNDQIPTLDNAEKITVTDIDGDTLTIVRAQDGTVAKPIGAGWRISAAIFTADFDGKQDKVGAKFTVGVTVVDPTAKDLIVWRAPHGARVVGIRAYRVGGSGASINARLNSTDNHLSSNLSVSSANTWMSGGTPQNTDYDEGDTLEIRILSVSGTPSQLVVQVDMETM